MHTHTHTPTPHCQSIPGFPSNYDHPGIIPGCTHIHILLPSPVRVSWDSLVTVTIPGSSRDAHTYTYSYPRQSIPGFPSNCDYPGIIPGCTHMHIPQPPVRVSRDSLVTVPIPGSSRDAHPHIPLPPVRVSRDSLVTVTFGSSNPRVGFEEGVKRCSLVQSMLDSNLNYRVLTPSGNVPKVVYQQSSYVKPYAYEESRDQTHFLTIFSHMVDHLDASFNEYYSSICSILT